MKSNAIKQDFDIRLSLTCQVQSTPKTIRILTKVFSTSGSHLVVLAWAGDDLSREQAQNGVNVDFEVKFDLEGQGQSHLNNRDLNQGTYGPNLAILPSTGDELSHGQTWWRMDELTGMRTDSCTLRQYPEAKTGLG